MLCTLMNEKLIFFIQTIIIILEFHCLYSFIRVEYEVYQSCSTVQLKIFIFCSTSLWTVNPSFYSPSHDVSAVYIRPHPSVVIYVAPLQSCVASTPWRSYGYTVYTATTIMSGEETDQCNYYIPGHCATIVQYKIGMSHWFFYFIYSEVCRTLHWYFPRKTISYYIPACTVYAFLVYCYIVIRCMWIIINLLDVGIWLIQRFVLNENLWN